MKFGSSAQSTRKIQYLICVFVASLFLLVFLPQTKSISDRATTLNGDQQLPSSSDGIVDYRRCSPLKPLRIFVHAFNHPLALALSDHPSATQDENEACLFIAFTDGQNHSRPSTWNVLEKPGLNHVIVNINSRASIAPLDREIIVQAAFQDGDFRPLLDFSLFPNVQTFDKETWRRRPSIMPLKRPIKFSVVVDAFDPDIQIQQFECNKECGSSLNSSSFCLLPASRSFHARLLESLRAGCIPVVMSASQPLPFQDHLDWNLASFRFARSLIAHVPELLEDLDKEDILEMRRRGRVFLARIDDAQALSKSLVAALSERIHVNFAVYPEVSSNMITPDGVFKNLSHNHTRIGSRFGTKKITASGMYSPARWNSGRDLTYTPNSLHEVPMMPGNAAFLEGTKDHIGSVNGDRTLGLTRDAEQFTVMILTYNRDNGVKKIIEKLRDCPYLNKIIIVWNNMERRPNGTWPEIHVPVEFILSERNSLSSRFVPYDRIETEAVVAIDDDMDLGQSEITFAFRIWRENRDRVVGYPERYHRFEKGREMYGLSGKCEYSMILTSFAFVHKYTYNQHPALLEHIDKQRNCEDIAINYLVSHLTRKPPLKVVKKASMNNGVKVGLSSAGDHYTKRDECVRMFNAVYGYNPLLFSQETARPTGGCVKGL